MPIFNLINEMLGEILIILCQKKQNIGSLENKEFWKKKVFFVCSLTISKNIDHYFMNTLYNKVSCLW